MGQETENIEAKLAAYVDGVLSAAERQEIETYLASNPEHRALIAELMKMRDEVRGLPKEPAPLDLSETLHGQLERSALLDGAEMPRPILRISRFPQLAALAAILLLTVGLGIVLYFVLFPAKPVSFSIAPTKAPATMEAPVAVADRSATAAAPAMPEKSAATEKNLEIAAAPLAKSTGGAGEANLAISQPTTPANDALVLVVATDNPELTQTQVSDYLKSNGIAAQPVNEPVVDDVSKPPPPNGADQLRSINPPQKEIAAREALAPALGASPANTSSENRDFAFSSKVAATQQADARKMQQQQPVQSKLQQFENTSTSNSANGYIVRGVTRRQADTLALTLNSRKGQLAYFSTDEAKQLAQNSTGVNQQAQNLYDQTRARTEAPVQQQQQQQQQANSAVALRSSDKDSPIAEKQDQQHTFAGKTESAAGGVVAANALPATTAPSQSVQTVVPGTEATINAAPAPLATATTQEAAQAPATASATTIAKNDTLMISISDLAGPGQESVLRATVADDGSINLPQVGKISVAGLTALQCQDAISEQCKQANLVANATVSVRRLDEVAAGNRPAPGTGSTGTGIAAPMLKSSAATPPRDEKLDMLILLRNQQPQGPSGSPLSPQNSPTTAPTGKF